MRERLVSNKLRILTVCGIILLVSLPLLTKGIANGHDMDFHFMRIEGLAQELSRGIFPVRMSSAWMDGYGYPISVFYGDILLYVPAILRAIGLPMITAYKLFLLAINSGTVVISFVCFKKIFQSETIASLAALAYATAGYRFVCLYVRAAVGECTAMMFLPLIALAVYKFYTLDEKNWNSYRRYAVVLALGLTGVLTSHLASTEMIVATLILLGLTLWKKSCTRSVFRSYALATIETIGLSAFFLVPFLDYMITYYITPALARTGVEFAANGSVDGIREAWFTGQANGAYVAQYFSFFQNIFGWSGVSLTSRLGLTPGLALMAVLVIAVAKWVLGTATREIKLLVAMSIVILFMASDLFPWDFLWPNTLLGKFLAMVQFPWRYLSMAIVFLTMLLGAVYPLTAKNRNARKDYCMLVVGACVMMSLFYVSNYSNDSEMRYDYDATPDTYAYMDGQYLRVDLQTPHSFTGEGFFDGMRNVELLNRDGTHIELYCETAETNGTIELPILNYKGYQVTDEYGSQYEVVDGTDNVIRFTVPAGFAGRITVDFVEPWYWHAGEAVSLGTVLAICIPAIVRWRRSRTHALAGIQDA